MILTSIVLLVSLTPSASGRPMTAPALTAADPAVRRAAVKELGERGDSQHRSTLLHALNDRDSGVRLEAATALANDGEEAALRGLLAPARQDTDPAVRRVAVAALGRLGKYGLDVLGVAVQDPDLTIRQAAINSLGQTGLVEALPHLTLALRDAHSEVRLTAIHALGAIGPVSLNLLVAALNDPEPLVRIAILEAIQTWEEEGRGGAEAVAARLGDHATGMERLPPEAMPEHFPSVGMVAAKTLGRMQTDQLAGVTLALADPNPRTRRNAVVALVGLTHPLALTYLHIALQDTHPTVRQQAVWGLQSRGGGPVSIENLTNALHAKDIGTRFAAVQTLSRVQPPAWNALIEGLGDQESYVRNEITNILRRAPPEHVVKPLIAALAQPLLRLGAAGTLAHFKHPRAYDPLFGILTDPLARPLNRQEAALALGVLRDPRAVPTLKQLARNDPDHAVRGGCERALESIGVVDSPLIKPRDPSTRR